MLELCKYANLEIQLSQRDDEEAVQKCDGRKGLRALLKVAHGLDVSLKLIWAPSDLTDDLDPCQELDRVSGITLVPSGLPYQVIIAQNYRLYFK